jgi:VIT1/CCC1 family predicted Fe2+/Mn2+ transporter
VTSFIQRNLAPGERLGEVLFGLLMTLTFVLGARILEGEAFSVRATLMATLGCNVAWGIIDGVLLVTGRVFDRSRLLRLGRSIRDVDDSTATQLVAAEFDETLAPMTSAPVRLELYRDVVRQVRAVKTPRSPLPRGEDWLAALAVFCLVVFVSMPAALPFLVMDDAWLALRVSNAILIGMVFLVGYKWGSATGMSPWGTGLSLASLCLVLVLIAIPLGG